MAVLAAVSMAVSACSTHESRFEAGVPPPPSDHHALPAAAATRMVDRYASQIALLPTEALPPLLEAAVTKVVPGHGAGTRVEVDALAEALIRRVPELRGDRRRVSTISIPRRSRLVSVSGAALLLAYRTTEVVSYRRAAMRALGAVTSAELGWRTRGGVAGVRSRASARRLDVAATADAAWLLLRAGDALGRPTRSLALRAIRALTAELSAPSSPTSLEEGALTSRVLMATRERPANKLGERRATALFRSYFRPSGEPKRAAQREPVGLGQALVTFQALSAPDGNIAEVSIEPAFRRLRSDATVPLAPASDPVAQAYFALALAIRASVLLQERS